MVFSSPIFLFLFLPIFLAGYYLLLSPVMLSSNRTVNRLFLNASNAFILAASLLFYFWGETWFVIIMLASTLIDYFCGLAIGYSTDARFRRLFLVLSIASNLTLLGYFKYIDFGVGSFNSFAAAAGLHDLRINGIAGVALPLGISFYTFQSMSYTIDVYRGNARPTRNLLGFACYVTMFPQLVAGPIVRYRDVAVQIFERRVSREMFTTGCLRFILGLGKKVLIANVLAAPADRIFSIPAGQLPPGVAWLGIACYSLQIYFDFSGYSDMAIGLGRMLGFNFLENFNYPYFAKSVREFWRRWHISLSNWFRDYVYIPLGGGRGSKARVYLNLVTVFFLCGLWHGASWTFVAWGLYHGAFMMFERAGLEGWLERRWLPLRHLYAVFVVMAGWVIFRADTFSHAAAYFQSLAGLTAGDAVRYNLQSYLNREVAFALAAGALLSWPTVQWLRGWREKVSLGLPVPARQAAHYAYSGIKLAAIAAVGLYSAMNIAAGAYNPFIYFRF